MWLSNHLSNSQCFKMLHSLHVHVGLHTHIQELVDTYMPHCTCKNQGEKCLPSLTFYLNSSKHWFSLCTKLTFAYLLFHILLGKGILHICFEKFTVLKLCVMAQMLEKVCLLVRILKDNHIQKENPRNIYIWRKWIILQCKTFEGIISKIRS